MTGIRNIEERVRQAAQAADERARKLQSRVQDLEAENLARGLEIKQMERERTELRHQLDAKRPDLAAAIAARDETSKKLSNALKVIEDLVRERQVRVCLVLRGCSS